ncbi:MAG: HNH endonuclease signature motif containing protein [Phycisphaerae bacterium]|jgi:5-methylcytosine-specific restriction endonuclease McrA
MTYGYELNDGIRIISESFSEKYRGWNVCINEESDLWNQPSRQLIKALNEAKKLLPYAKELMEIDMRLYKFEDFRVDPNTAGQVKEVLSNLKNVENNPFANEATKKFVRDILEQYDQYQTRKGLQRNTLSTIRRKVIARDKNTCRYCGKQLDKKEIHIDHIIPYTLGGRTELDNLVVACVKCNLKKSGRTLEELNMKIINRI